MDGASCSACDSGESNVPSPIAAALVRMSATVEVMIAPCASVQDGSQKVDSS